MNTKHSTIKIGSTQMMLIRNGKFVMMIK